MKLSLLLSLVLLAGAPSGAYPIPPQPLRKIYREADLVATVIPGATVRGVSGAFVDVKVLKCFKGKADQESIRVFYEPLVLCPPSASFPKGNTVLAFLTRGRDGLFIPFACSYSTKLISEASLRAYEGRMAELARMKESQLKAIPDAEVLEWLIKCAEHPATRMEAIYEFQGSPDYPPPLDEIAEPIRFDSLTEGQRGRLVKALLDSKELGSPEASLAEFLMPVKDRRIDSALREGLAKAIANKNSFLGNDLMEVLAQRLDIKKWSTIQKGMYEWKTDEFGERFSGYAEESKRLKVLENALALVDSKLK